MKTIHAIVELARQAQPGERMAMATVVNVRGSSYRRPGARLVLTESGRSTGMISGGCLENDARERCRQVMKSGVPQLVSYDSTAPEDIVFGLGLGCNGVVEVLIEPVTVGDGLGLLALFEACETRRQMGRVATVFRSGEIDAGSRLLRWPDGTLTTNFDDAALSAALMQAIQKAGTLRNMIGAITLPDGRSAEVLLENILPPVSLTVFSAGDDAMPLVHLAKGLGWQVTVVDARPAYANHDRFPEADAVHCLRPESCLAHAGMVIASDSLVVVMTHSFVRDLELLRELMPRALRYLGVIGSKARTQQMLTQLSAEGVMWKDRALETLHGPAGLDIGAETPEEIAVALIAEMQAVLARRHGGALRDRNAPIHDPVESTIVTP